MLEYGDNTAIISEKDHFAPGGKRIRRRQKEQGSGLRFAEKVSEIDETRSSRKSLDKYLDTFQLFKKKLAKEQA